MYNEVGQVVNINDLFILNNNMVEIDVSKLRSGIYFISLRSNDKIITKQFIKK